MASWNTDVGLVPDYGAEKETSIVTREVQLGDGYRSMQKFGLNTDLKKWNLRFSNITETEADTAEAFLEARGGQESFSWTAPGEPTISRYICKKWKKTFPYSNLATITAIFEEVVNI